MNHLISTLNGESPCKNGFADPHQESARFQKSRKVLASSIFHCNPRIRGSFLANGQNWSNHGGPSGVANLLNLFVENCKKILKTLAYDDPLAFEDRPEGAGYKITCNPPCDSYKAIPACDS